MKIKKTDRIIFEKNPLKEVIVQIRFPRNMEIEQGLPVAFQKEISKDFPLVEIQEQHSVTINFAKNFNEPQNEKGPSIFHFSSQDQENRVSLTSTYIALTLKSYVGWEEFHPIVVNLFNTLRKFYTITLVTRIGLRYRNLISRNEYNISEPWSKLINPGILGPSGILTQLIDGEVDERKIKASRLAFQIELENYSLILQSGLADKAGEQKGDYSFYIDTDFFNQKNIKSNELDLLKELEVLHADSGSIFRQCISDTLLQAFKPIA